jgi:hypothetical protein
MFTIKGEETRFNDLAIGEQFSLTLPNYRYVKVGQWVYAVVSPPTSTRSIELYGVPTYDCYKTVHNPVVTRIAKPAWFLVEDVFLDAVKALEIRLYSEMRMDADTMRDWANKLNAMRQSRVIKAEE